jgi:pantoate--beta-alanine ligase
MTELQVFDALLPLQALLATQRKSGRRIGLVPTMGNLHAGHLALVAEARMSCDFIVATLFVNPLQFGPQEDLSRYPRSFESDCAALQDAECDALFAPAAAHFYPEGLAAHTRISVPGVSALHCGASRPGHFDGVCTVVCKLFNMTQPDHAFFGLKDFQQFHLINCMVRDLQMPVQLHGLPTVREASGLALSSRNGYLSADERGQAPQLYATLQLLAWQLSAGEQNFQRLEEQARSMLESAGLRPDYVHICQRDTLLPATIGNTDLVILAAAFVGKTRLIDNILVSLAP